jgi:hypothetical protein
MSETNNKCNRLSAFLFIMHDAYQIIGKCESGEKISNHIAPISIDEIRGGRWTWPIY